MPRPNYSIQSELTFVLCTSTWLDPQKTINMVSSSAGEREIVWEEEGGREVDWRGRGRQRELSSARCMNESSLALRMTIENRIENKIKAIKCIPISSTRHLDLALRIYSIYWKHIKTSNSNNNKQQVDAATWSCKDVFTDFRSHKVNAAECAKRQDRVLIGNRWGCRRSCCRYCCCCCSWASMRLLKLLLLLLLLWRRLLSSVMTRPLHLSSVVSLR